MNIIDQLKERIEKLRIEWKEKPSMRVLIERRAKLLKELLEKYEKN